MDIKKRKISEEDIRTRISLVYMDEIERLRIAFKELKIENENNINQRMDLIDERLNILDTKMDEIKDLINNNNQFNQLKDLIENVLIKNSNKIEELENENQNLKIELSLLKNEEPSTPKNEPKSKYDFYY